MLQNFELRILNIGGDKEDLELAWMLLDLENKDNRYQSSLKQTFSNVDDMTSHLCEAIKQLCLKKLNSDNAREE